jgi:hypothetical protein
VVLNALVQMTDQRSVYQSVQVPDHVLSPHGTFAHGRLRPVEQKSLLLRLACVYVYAYMGLRATAKVIGSCRGHQAYTVAFDCCCPLRSDLRVAVFECDGKERQPDDVRQTTFACDRYPVTLR